VAFAPGESFFGNFLRVLGGPGMDAEVHFCTPIPVTADGRRRLAESARGAICAALGLPEANERNSAAAAAADD